MRPQSRARLEVEPLLSSLGFDTVIADYYWLQALQLVGGETLRFFILNKQGEYAGVAMYGSGERAFAVCDENGAREEPLEGLLEGRPQD